MAKEIDELDFTKILEPISSENPVGSPVAFDESFEKLKALRKKNEAVIKDRWEPLEEVKADWLAVQDLCIEILEKRSKDLTVASYLVEAQLHLYSYEGLLSGLKLFYALCEKFWESCYPEIEKDDLEARSAPIEWINQKLSAKVLALLPISAPTEKTLPIITYYDFDKVKRNEKNKGSRQKTPPTLTPDIINKSLDLSPQSYFAETKVKIDLLNEVLKDFDRFFSEKAINDLANFANLETVLEKISDFLDAKMKQKENKTENAQEEDFLVSPASSDPSVSSGNLSLANRAQAYAKLKEISEFFKKTEPHSPTPLVIARVLAWENKSISEILDELIQSEEEKGLLFHILGVGNSKGREEE